MLNAQGGGFDALATRATGLTNRNTTVTRREIAVSSTYAAVDSQTEMAATFDLLGVRHTVLAGVEYTDGYRRADQAQSTNYPSVSFLSPVPGSPIVGLQFQSDLKQKNELTGLYVQDQIDLGSGVRLLVGVRDDTGTQFYFSRTPTSRTIPPDQRLSGTSPRVGLIYRPVEPLTLYASYATSFKPQTANVLNAVDPRPESGELHEIGGRLDLTPDLTLYAAAFRIVRNNVAASDPVNSGFSVITGQQQSEGIEADLAGQILPGRKVIGAISFLDARITKDTTYAVGDRLVGAPALSGSVRSTYRFQEGLLLGWNLGAGITYVGRRAGDLNNSFSVGGYARLDAAVFYDVSEHARFSINMRNLTDRRYVEQPFDRFNNLPGAPLSVLAAITARL